MARKNTEHLAHKMKKTKQPQNVSAYLPKDLKEILLQMKEKEDRPLSRILARLIRIGLKHDKESKQISLTKQE